MRGKDVYLLRTVLDKVPWCVADAADVAARWGVEWAPLLCPLTILFLLDSKFERQKQSSRQKQTLKKNETKKTRKETF